MKALGRFGVLAACVISMSSLVSPVLAQPPSKTSQPEQQFLTPAEAPSVSSLKDAQIVTERHVQGSGSTSPATVTPQAMPGCRYDDPIVGYENCYSYYQGNSASVDWTQKLRGVVRVDNLQYPVPTTLKYTQQFSGSHTFQLTGSVQATAEAELKTPIINFASTTLSGQIIVSGSGTWSWSTSTTVEDQMEVPGGKVGYIYCYNSGGVVGGTAYYDLFWTDRDGIRRYMGVQGVNAGGKTPSQGIYNFQHILANS